MNGIWITCCRIHWEAATVMHGQPTLRATWQLVLQSRRVKVRAIIVQELAPPFIASDRNAARTVRVRVKCVSIRARK